MHTHTQLRDPQEAPGVSDQEKVVKGTQSQVFCGPASKGAEDSCRI